MAVDRTPTALFADYASSGTPVDTFAIKLTDVVGLTAAQADDATGDYPAILLSIMQQALAHYTGLATADKPTMFSIRQLPQAIPSSGTYAGLQPYKYELTFYGSVAVASGVEAEPVSV